MNKRTHALQIPRKVKEQVWIRQNGKSIYSGKPITIDECCCHVVPKSAGGMGIIENVVGLTLNEHPIFDLNLPGDHKEEHDKIRAVVMQYLKECYPNWSEEDVTYKMWYEQKPKNNKIESYDISQEQLFN